MPDYVSSSTSTTGAVSVNSSVAGEIETTYDHDWYRVTLTANVTYTVRVVGRGTSTYTLEDPAIEGIFNSSGNYVAGFNNDGLISGPYGRDAMTTYRPTAGGTYFIAVSGGDFTVGTFLLSVTDSSGATDTVLASTATTGAITVGGAAVSGRIDNADDVDWYRVALSAGTSYTITMRGLASGSGTLADPVIAGVFDSSGNYIRNTYVDDFGSRDPSLTFVAPYTGNYYIAADGWDTFTGTFTLGIAALGANAADVPGNTSTSATLTVGASTSVKMEQPFDHDWYAVTLEAGRTYQFSLSGSGSGGLNSTPNIHGIYNSAGAYVGGYAAATLGTLSASATTIFTPTNGGTYYIDAYSIYAGTYELTASQVADDVPANKNTTATVAVNGSVTGNIGGGTDIDWYKINLVAGTTYVIKMEGSPSGNGTLEDPVIAGIYDANGILIPSTFADDTNGSEASLVFRPTATGTYYIAADGYAGYTGTYKLSVASVGGDVGHTTATAGAVALNTPMTVSIDDAADADWYAITLTGGVTYGVRLLGSDSQRGTLSDPQLTGIYDSNGAIVPGTFVDDSRGISDAILSFTPATSGTYYVATEGYNNSTGTMMLMVTVDYVGNTNATAVNIAVGSAVSGNIDDIGDVDRYAVALQASSTYYIRMLGKHSLNGDLADPHISAVRNASGAAQSLTTITEATTIGTDAWVKLTTGSTGAGTYYIDAEGANSTDGSFLLSANKDTAGSTATTESIAIGSSTSSFIDEGTDADWFAVSLNANNGYVIKMLGRDSGNGSLTDPLINGVRFGTNTTAIANTTVNDSVARDAYVYIVPTSTGVHYIAAASNGNTAVGSYVLSIEAEVGNTNASAGSLTVGGSVNGTINGGNDSDWYKIALAANTGYLFRMTSVTGGTEILDDPNIAAIRSSGGTGQTIVRTNNGTTATARMVSSGTAGDYYIDVGSLTTDYGDFILTAETETGHTIASARSISVGQSVTDTIDDGTDIDYFRVALNSNSSYIIRMLGTDSGNGTLGDPNIAAIRNSSNATQTIASSSSMRDSIVRFAPGSTTDYFIDAQSGGTDTGTYTLIVEAEAGDTNARAGSITVGSSVMAAIDDTNDIDRYAVTLTGSVRYRIRMEGADSGNGTLGDPYINGIRNASGTVQSNTTQGGGGTGRDAVVIFTPSGTSAATYYIDADNSNSTVGTYKLTVELWP